MEYNRELVGGDSSLDRIEGIKTTLSKVNFTSDPDDQFKYKLDKQLGDKQYVMMPDRGDGFLRQRTRWNSFCLLRIIVTSNVPRKLKRNWKQKDTKKVDP